MSLMPWLNSWLGHVSADMSLHDCPVISTTGVAITPMELMVIFKKKMVSIRELTHTIPFLQLSCFKSCHYCTIFCKALLFFSSCPKGSANIPAKSWMMSCWHVIWQVGPTFFFNAGPTFSTFLQHADICQNEMSCGGLGNMTWCWHFQLRVMYMMLRTATHRS